MSIFRSPELRGILGLIVVIAVVGVAFAAATGKLEQWFGITIFAGPRALDKIIFVSDSSGTSEIFMMNTDGSGRRQLTNNMQVFSVPAISPLGNRIVFVGRYKSREFGRAQDQVFAVGVGGGMPIRLTSATGPKRRPAYSPDGKKLSFIASGKVYIAEPDGDNPEPVLPTEKELHAAIANPLLRNRVPTYSDYCWQRNSQGILGVTEDSEGHDIVVYLREPRGEASPIPPCSMIDRLLQDANMPELRITSDEPLRITGMGWASEADVFAVCVAVRKSSFLLAFEITDGKLGLRGFKPFEGEVLGRPALLPDGSEMVVPTRSLDGKSASGILTVNLESGQTHVVASGLFENPSYSPKGDKILATRLSKDGKSRDVVTIEVSSGKVKQLTNDGKSYNAIWSPASKK